MANFISEDDIEIAVLGKLSKAEFGYDILKCDPDPNKRENLDDGSGNLCESDCLKFFAELLQIGKELSGVFLSIFSSRCFLWHISEIIINNY